MSGALARKPMPFEIANEDGYRLLRISGDAGMDSIRSFEAEIPRLVEKPYQHVIVNCEGLLAVSNPWIRALLRLCRDVQATLHDVRFIQVPHAIEVQLAREGVGGLLKICPTLRQALTELGLVAKKSLNVEFINPFLVATLHVLKVQAMTEARAGVLYRKQEADSFLGDISGMIGLVSDTFNGAVVITFPEATFLKIISRMLGEEFTTLTKEIADGAGELTNIIFGQAKIALNDKGYGIRTALPSVITGKNHSVSGLTKGPVVVVPFDSDVGPFFIEICMSE